MKFTSAALALALSGSAMAGGADTVNAVLKEIADDLKAFDTAINGWQSGDISALDAASKKIQTATESGAAKINGGDSLSLVDAAGITSNVQGLQTQLDTTLRDLQKIGDKLASSGQCGNIQGQLKSQSAAANSLQEAITNKAPPEAKPIAQQLGGSISASIKETQAYFDKTCAGAPGGGSGGGAGGGAGGAGGAPKSGGGAGGAGGSMPAGHNGMGGMGGSGSGSGAGAGAGAGGAGARPAQATGAPKPATYAGAGASVKVPYAIAIALAAFAL